MFEKEILIVFNCYTTIIIHYLSIIMICLIILAKSNICVFQNTNKKQKYYKFLDSQCLKSIVFYNNSPIEIVYKTDV